MIAMSRCHPLLSNNVGGASKWKPLTPAKEPASNPLPNDVSAKPINCELQENNAVEMVSPSINQRGESSATFDSGNVPATNASQQSQQDHTLSPYFFNVNVPYSAPFPFPPYFNSFFRSEFMPPFLFPPSSYGTPSVEDGLPVLQPPNLPPQSSRFTPPTQPQNVIASSLPTHDLSQRTESANKTSPRVDPKPVPTQMLDPVGQTGSSRSSEFHSSEKLEKRREKGVPAADDASLPNHRTNGAPLPSSDVHAYENQPICGALQNRSLGSNNVSEASFENSAMPSDEHNSQSSLAAAATMTPSSQGVASLTSSLDPYRTNLAQPSPSLMLSPASEGISHVGEKRQRPTRQAAINAAKVTAEQLNDMHPSTIASSIETVVTGGSSESSTIVTNASPTRPRGGNRSRGSQRGSRGRGGAKRASTGVFEPKLVSGLSSLQDLAGTVYDFDDFGDDFGDSDRHSSVGSRSIRKPETTPIHLSEKSPKNKSLSSAHSGPGRMRKSRELSSETNIEVRDGDGGEISCKLYISTTSIEKPTRKITPPHSETPSSVSLTTPIQTVPPMKLTIPRNSFSSVHHPYDSNQSVPSADISIRNAELPPSSVGAAKREFPISLTTSSAFDCSNNQDHQLPMPLNVTAPSLGVSCVSTPPPTDSLPRFISMPAPSVKAMQDLEALDRAIESALAAKPQTTELAIESARPDHATPSIPVAEKSFAAAVPTTNNTTITSIDSSRHALKFKIKGPFLDANYSSSSASNLPPPFNANNTTSTPSNESSNLRRMRKKELIRQYVSQDITTPTQPAHLSAFLHFPYSSALAYANEEYLLAGSNDLNEVIGSTNAGTFPSMDSHTDIGGIRNHVSIPKAVASLGSLEGHGDYFQGNVECDARDGKRRRRGNQNPPLSRELRNLQLSAATDDQPSTAERTMDTPTGRRKERRRGGRPAANQSTNEMTCLDVSLSEKSKNAQDFNVHPPPKLKIRFREKLGAGEVVTVCDPSLETPSNQVNSTMSTLSDVPIKDEDSEAKKIRFRPPKKRISDTDFVKPANVDPVRLENNPPTLEELWRQSMKFREEVMADFSKSERRKGQSQSIDEQSSKGRSDIPPSGIDSKPEFKNKRHKTKTRKDRSKSKDRDGNNRRRPPVASTDLVSIAGGGLESNELISSAPGDCEELGGRKRKRTPSGGDDAEDGHVIRNGAVRIISQDESERLTAPPKLIIRFGKKPVSGGSSGGGSEENNLSCVSSYPTSDLKLEKDRELVESQEENDITPPPPLEKPQGDDSTSDVTSLRLMPIKLKLARFSERKCVGKKKEVLSPSLILK